MITKKIFHPKAIFSYLKFEILFSTIIALMMYTLYTQYNWKFVGIPLSIATILGSALAIFLAFRNNNSYSRWWEARSAWSTLLAQSRIFARQILANTGISTGESEKGKIYQKDSLYRQIAYAHVLRMTLRGENAWETIASLLEKEEYDQFLTSHNKPNFLLTMQGKRIKEAMRDGILGNFDNISLEPVLTQCNVAQATCERIKGTPLLRQYHFFTKLFLMFFLTLLPMALIGEFSKIGFAELMIPVSIIIGFMFSVMSKVGEVNEDPFENRITDIPMTYVCNMIERDLREMLGESHLPEKLHAKDGYLY